MHVWRKRRLPTEPRQPASQLSAHLKGFAHYNFTDFALLSPLAQRIGLTGPVDGQHSVRLVNAYTSAFFDRYRKQVESPLLRATVAEYPEVTFQAHQAGQAMPITHLAALPRQ